LGIIYGFGLTHGNFEADGAEKDNVPVGSTVNIYCNVPNKRIIRDEWDDDPEDFLLTSLCQPDTNFELHVDDFPDCKAWCPSEKATPPPGTGLLIAPEHNNTR
jgi:hypothetical protein